MLSLLAARARINHGTVIDPVFYPLTLVNPDGTTTSGWTNQTGTLKVRRGYFFSQSATCRAYQDVDVPSELLGAVAAGKAFMVAEWNPGGYSGDNDSGEMELLSISSSSTVLNTFSSGLESWDADPSVGNRQNFGAPIDPAATKVRIQMHNNRVAGTDNNGYFDDLSLGILVTPGWKAWRVYITANNGSTAYHQMMELEFRAVAGGPSIAKNGRSFASSMYAATSSTPAYTHKAAFDGIVTDIGNFPDAWVSLNGSGGSPAYIGYICPVPDRVNEVAIWNSIATAGRVDMAPKDFVIQSSTDTTDGSDGTWIDEWTVTGQTGWTAGELRTFARP